MLIINYKEKKDNKKLKLYYEVLKDYPEEELYEAFIKTIRENKYFPNVNEIVVNIPHINEKKLHSWENIKSEKISAEEKQELEELLKEFK